MKNTIRKYWWIVIAIIFFSIAGIACPPLLGATKAGCDKACQARFRAEWRPLAASRLAEHIGYHRDCDLADSLPIVEKIQIFFSMPLPHSTLEAVFPDPKSEWPIAFVNPDYKWTEDEAALVIIHAATHWTKRKDGWLCGPDRQSRQSFSTNAPACRLFGKVQYNSDDINRDIREHLWP